MSQAAYFKTKRGLFYDNVANTGGIRTEKLRTVPGGEGEATKEGSGCNLVLLNARDPRATLELRDRLKREGVDVGLNDDPRWYPIPSNGWKDRYGRAVQDPLLYRRQASLNVSKHLRLGDVFVGDFEDMTAAWVRAFFCGVEGSSIDGWRGTNGKFWNGGTNQGRITAVTNYFHQDNPLGLLIDADVALLDQLYDERMNDIAAWQEREWVESDAEAEGRELADQFDPTGLVVCPIFDAKDYKPSDYVPGSYLFNQDRLAWLFTP